MMRKRIKRGGALLLASALVFAAMVMPEAQAADAVDTDAACTVKFSDAVPENQDEVSENNVPVTINLYKVAEIDEAGRYTEIAPFSGLGLDEVSSETTAEWWESCAEAAFGKVTEDMTAVWSGTTSGGEVTTTVLETGMYLIVPQEAESAYYTYNFEPTLVSLPDNYYYDENSGGNDDWEYNPVITLKPEQTERLGNVKINKNLLHVNTSVGNNATFVYQVSYTTPRGETRTELATVDLSEGNTEGMTVLVEGIPAGSQVTVTEEYTGAGYELVASANEGGTTVIADDTISWTFTNDTDGTWNGGYGVVNSYNVDEHGQYQWSSNAPAQEAE